MRVIIETADHKATVEVEQDDLKAREVLGLVREAMLASGFTEESIEKWMPQGPLLDGLIDSHS